jgi:hypothetical protein
MIALGQAGVTPTFTVEQAQRPRAQLPLKYPTRGYNLDILTPLKSWRYADLKGRSKALTLGSIAVRVVGMADLIMMKEGAVTHLESEAATIRAQVEKHRKDLARLRGEKHCGD